MPTTTFSDEEMKILADKIAERLLPDLIKVMRDKALWAVNQLQGEYLTAGQVATMFNISTQTVYRLAKEGHLASTKTGKGGIRFERNMIEQAKLDGKL